MKKKEKKKWELIRHGQKWTQKEEDLLRKLYPNLFTHELQKRFGRTLTALHAKAESMGLRKSWMDHVPRTYKKGKAWSKKEIKRLKKLYPVMPTSQLLIHFPKRSITSLRGEAQKLGLRKNYAHYNRSRAKLPAKLRIWSAKDIEKARTLWQQGYNKAQISEIIGKSFGGVLSQIFKQTRDFGLHKRYEHKVWSQKEVAYLIEHYKNTPAPQLSVILKREVYSIHQKARSLKLSSGAIRRWTEQETELLKKYYNQWPIEKLAKKLDRSIISVKGKAQNLHLLARREPWTAKEINFLKKHYRAWTTTKIAEKLGRTISSVYWRARQLNLLGPSPKSWTAEETKFVKTYYKKWTYPEIARKLGTTADSVARKVASLGLRKKNFS